jgi:phosphatidylinositol alpha-1,6-mannosyltransferase
MALLEAQIAGTAVVAPAFGGSGDAFQPAITGLAPVDESPEALAGVLAELLYDEDRRGKLGHAAAAWSQARFEPTTYGNRVLRTLLSDTDFQSGQPLPNSALLETP